MQFSKFLNFVKNIKEKVVYELNKEIKIDEKKVKKIFKSVLKFLLKSLKFGCLILIILVILTYIAVAIWLYIDEVNSAIRGSVGIETKKGPNMHYARYDHSQATLDDGNVLVIGGVGDDVQHQPELYLAKKNKFIKLKKTECAYHSPEIFKDTKGRVIISESTCKNDVAFNSETRTFENITESVKKDTKLDINSKFQNKETTEIDIKKELGENRINQLDAKELDERKLGIQAVDRPLILWNLPIEKTRAVEISKNNLVNKRQFIFMCDKGEGIALQRRSQNLIIYVEDRAFMFSRIAFDYPILNAPITKIGEDKFLVTGGSTNKEIGKKIPHKYSQILQINKAKADVYN